MTRVGIFIDADNLLPFWLSAAQAPARAEPISHYIRTEDFNAMLTEIDELANNEGSVVFREAYGAWANSARQVPASLMYHEYGYDLQHVPALSRERTAAEVASDGGPRNDSNPSTLKNAGDILLSVRATLAATRGYALDTIIVGAADKDYHQLVAELKRLGKRVVCLAFHQRGQQAKLLLKTFDDVLELTAVHRWDQLDLAQDRRAKPAPRREIGLCVEQRPVEPSKPTIIRDPFVLSKEVWNATTQPGATVHSLQVICVIDHHFEPALADRFLTFASAAGCLLANENGLALPDEQYEEWKIRLVRCLVDAIIAEFAESRHAPTLPPAEWIEGARAAATGRFGVRGGRLNSVIEEVVGERAVGIAGSALTADR